MGFYDTVQKVYSNFVGLFRRPTEGESGQGIEGTCDEYLPRKQEANKFSASDEVLIGNLEFLVTDPVSKYGSNVEAYFEKLTDLSGKQMGFGILESQFLQSLQDECESMDHGWNIAYYTKRDDELVFRAVVTEFAGPRYGHFSIMNHPNNHDVARLHLEKIN